MTPNSILNVAEAALQTALQNQIYQISPDLPIYHSDENAPKDSMPYLIIHCEDAREDIGPGSGIYRVPVVVTLRSHVKPQTEDNRDAIVTAINNFVYSNPAQVLSETDGFHCYGFMPIEVKMEVNTDLKAYEYVNRFELVCMPRNNS